MLTSEVKHSSHVVRLLTKLFVLVNCSIITPIVELNSPHVIPSSVATSSSIDRGSPRNTSRIKSLGFTYRCAKSNPNELQMMCFSNAILGSGQTFRNASEFCDAAYLISLVGRFRYRFKKNTPQRMSLVCTIDNCPWKITCQALGVVNVVQVHIFENTHNHSLDDVTSSQPTIRANRASMVIDDVIRSTPEYQPRQICKDFVRQHGLRLTYNQAWNLKEKDKEKEHIYRILNIIISYCCGCVRELSKLIRVLWSS